MISLRAYFAGVQVAATTNEVSLFPTDMDSCSNFFEVMNVVMQMIEENDELLINLPERKKAHSDQKEKKALIIPRIKHYADSGVFVFDFWKVNFDLDDRRIFDAEFKKVDSLKRLVALKQSQGSLVETVCCYDYSNRVLIWRDVNGISKKDIEYYFGRLTKRKINFNLISDPNTDRDFGLMDVEKISLEVEVSNNEQLARSLSNDALERVGLAKRLLDIANETETGRIKVVLTAGSNNRRSLKKQVIGESIPFLRQWLAAVNINRKPKDHKGLLRAEGRLQSNKAGINAFENRVVDLFEGLFIRKIEVDESINEAEQEILIDNGMIKLSAIGRELLPGRSDTNDGR